ncbi:efflux RND transporter periplasmic adaptor subunit [Undibacterium sp.]|uniref:efflux RND transporter periplasmic adaptor subunit n=1 Tax=Undibacterium sp. TaxID=1914977 RepID=UPI00272F2534|nr:efflux RND transporter periplasmic adaptor subunit [Undibacterium sp.]MDP1979453.1 efflux RND transporter periplasmic adaptor subunit [Undibacterium sp.]
MSVSCYTVCRSTKQHCLNKLLLFVLLPFMMTACGDKPKAVPPDITPRVKTVTAQAGGEQRYRSLVGELQPAEVWNLAFPVQGRVMQIAVNEGDKVKKGQVLARLDPLAYELKLKNAQSGLQSAITERKEKLDALAAQSKLREQGYMTGNMLEKQRVELAASETRLSNSESALALAKRDLDYTVLLAPAEGRISARLIEAFADVNAGQSIMRLDGAAGLRVAIRVPDKLMSGFNLGTAVKVQIGERKLDGKVSRIDARATAGDAFPSYISLTGDTTGLRPGVTANVQFTLGSDASQEAQTRKNMVLPLQAIVPGNAPGRGFAFVLDGQSGKVRRVEVRIKAVNEQDVEVDEGLKAGDEVVVAGVAFLSDGQVVKALQKDGKGGSRI